MAKKRYEIGQIIKEARLNSGLTQIQLAEKCRLNIRTVQRIETGKVIPRFYTLQLINEVLGTNFPPKSNNIGESSKNIEQITWKRNVLSTNYTLFSEGNSIGKLFNNTLSQSGSGTIKGVTYRFQTTGFFIQKTKILNDSNVVVGYIEYNQWMTTARLTLFDNVYYWRFDNLLYKKWSVFNSDGLYIHYISSMSNGEVHSNFNNHLLLLSGLFIANFYWQIMIVLIIILLVFVGGPILI